ncbi:MAG: hypothetical protein EXR75_02705 [Myxococcales bacterium]|nr:hypothetical protein [Myxococcales bacterium]
MAMATALGFLMAFIEAGVRQSIEHLGELGDLHVTMGGAQMTVMSRHWRHRGPSRIEPGAPFLAASERLVETALAVARLRPRPFTGCAACSIPLDRAPTWQRQATAVRCERCGLDYHPSCRTNLVRCWRWGCEERTRVLWLMANPMAVAKATASSMSYAARVGNPFGAPATSVCASAGLDAFALRCRTCGERRPVDLGAGTLWCARCANLEGLDPATGQRLHHHLALVTQQRSGGGKPTSAWRLFVPFIGLYAVAFAGFKLAESLYPSAQRSSPDAGDASALIIVATMVFAGFVTMTLFRLIIRPREKHPLRRAVCAACGNAAPVRRGFPMPCPVCSRLLGAM